MEIALGIACSHAGLIATRRDQGSPDQSGRYFAAADLLREQIRDLAPDAIVVLGTDHMKAYTLAGGIPPAAIGVGTVAHGLGDAGVPARDIPVHADLAAGLLEAYTAAGGALTFAEEIRIDHSFVVPLDLFDPEASFPIVAITQNCNVPPRPTMQAGYDLGTGLRAAIDTLPGRVVFIATGGLSHWVGDERRRAFMQRQPGSRLADLAQHPVELEETGPVNERFDKEFLDAVQAGDIAGFLRGWPDDRLEQEAGNGAHELRNWATAAGFLGDAPGEVLAYEPIAEWLTGVGIVRFTPSGN
ncbi:hypothetical protein [Jiangella mangrovi]|uniref:Aromatic ring-opening dioxygenase catalytic subunit (LigB family) n=1 Tax=Jiangella mangrovi TaxID=1524084 RepID=A0A7W9GLT9_9ACTN|nr:hypothetical protein [Jiangella mangrovi]MBB5786129.1 aromatic ring-opening dioxygenase catalytic subunit (LigB family) [Jiangella mangrovi]